MVPFCGTPGRCRPRTALPAVTCLVRARGRGLDRDLRDGRGRVIATAVAPMRRARRQVILAFQGAGVLRLSSLLPSAQEVAAPHRVRARAYARRQAHEGWASLLHLGFAERISWLLLAPASLPTPLPHSSARTSYNPPSASPGPLPWPIKLHASFHEKLLVASSLCRAAELARRSVLC